MDRPADLDRQTRILDAAESAFAECGFAGASLRRIVAEAGVNLATVYYYFRSKEGLMGAVLQRRFGSLRQEQLARLKTCGRRAPRRARVERILEAMIAPPLRLAAARSADAERIRRLIGRIVTEPNPQTQALLRRHHDEVRVAFVEAVRECLPALPLPVLLWRLEFVWGALAFVLCNPRNLEEATQGVCDPEDVNKVMAQMIVFFASGLRAPGPG